MVDSHIKSIRPVLLENTPLIPVLDELVLDYLRLLYVGQYKRGNLKDLPYRGTHTLMLKIHVQYFYYRLYGFFHEGEVDVIRDGSRYIFKFTNAGEDYELTQGRLYSTDMSFIIHETDRCNVVLLPHKFE